MTQAQALDILKTGANVFLTGEPGSGKTHTVNAYVSYLRDSGIEPSITASTGIAATHIGGMTIHSWSGVGIKTSFSEYDIDRIASTEYIAKRIRRTSVLIVDEVSMLHPSMLEVVDAICRAVKGNQEPFGGIQVVCVGDFFQLPPVVRRGSQPQALNRHGSGQAGLGMEPEARFVYQAPIWEKLRFLVCYLTEQHRQDDAEFLSVLSAIRSNSFDEQHFELINRRRVAPAAIPKEITKLFSHNEDVDRVNAEHLARLPAKPHAFSMSSVGREALIVALKKGCLSPETLELKVGAAVMFTKNNLAKGFVNGTLGTVDRFESDTGNPVVKTRSGRMITAERVDWAVEENGLIRAKVSQVPLRLAWAMTVHKSQGMSLDAAVMDLGGVFEYGQGYVALSRVRRLSGLFLTGWNQRAYQVHPDVLSADQLFRERSAEAGDAFAAVETSELSRMHDAFVVASGGKKATGNGRPLRKVAPVKGDTHELTLVLWNEGKTVSEIAEARGLKPQTIFNHIEELFSKGKIGHADLSRLLSPELSCALKEIHGAFQALGTRSLSPVFEKLNGKHSYDNLRIARMFLD